MLRFWFVFLGLTVSGCAVHQIDSAPAPDVQPRAQYSVQGASEKQAQEAWYKGFGDARLSALIETAQNKNLDARQAMARIAQARAFETQARASRLPSLDANGDIGREWDDGRAQETVSRIGADVAWEIDLFNRLGSEQAARGFEAQASEDDLAAVRLSFSTEIAQNYYGAIARHRQLALLRAQIESDQKLLGLIRQRLDAGVGTNVEVLQQQSQLAENESLIPLEEAGLRVTENRLDVLLADAPDGADRTVSGDIFPVIAAIPPTGIPADLLLNRPDLRALKNRLIAQDAEIAVAMAERLPRISLSGSLVFVDGTSAASPVVGILGGLVQPLLDWGQRKAEVERNKALYEEKLAEFTQAYLVAIEEVENTLYQENKQREYLKRLETRRGLLAQTLVAAEAVYRQGESDYLPVLAAVEDLRGVERTIVREELNLILFRIALFKALGGSVDAVKESGK